MSDFTPWNQNERIVDFPCGPCRSNIQIDSAASFEKKKVFMQGSNLCQLPVPFQEFGALTVLQNLAPL